MEGNIDDMFSKMLGELADLTQQLDDVPSVCVSPPSAHNTAAVAPSAALQTVEDVDLSMMLDDLCSFEDHMTDSSVSGMVTSTISKDRASGFHGVPYKSNYLTIEEGNQKFDTLKRSGVQATNFSSNSFEEMCEEDEEDDLSLETLSKDLEVEQKNSQFQLLTEDDLAALSPHQPPTESISTGNCFSARNINVFYDNVHPLTHKSSNQFTCDNDLYKKSNVFTPMYEKAQDTFQLGEFQNITNDIEQCRNSVDSNLIDNATPQQNFLDEKLRKVECLDQSTFQENNNSYSKDLARLPALPDRNVNVHEQGVKSNQLSPNNDIDKEEREERIKSEKMKVALEKMKEARIQKLVVKVFNKDESSKTLMIDERMTVRSVMKQLIEKNHYDYSPNWALIEELPSLYMERMFEEHEKPCELMSYWTRDTTNQLRFIERKDKYALFKNPQHYLLSHSDYQDQMQERQKQTLLEEFFSGKGPSSGVPEVEGFLHIKADSKSWTKKYCVLRSSGLYVSKSGEPKKGKRVSDLNCLIMFDQCMLYLGRGWKKKYKSPFEYGFALKHPAIQLKSKHIRYLCCEDFKSLMRWSVGIRLAKYGRQLLNNYEKTNDEVKTSSNVAPSFAFRQQSQSDAISIKSVSSDGSGSRPNTLPRSIGVKNVFESAWHRGNQDSTDIETPSNHNVTRAKSVWKPSTKKSNNWWDLQDQGDHKETLPLPEEVPLKNKEKDDFPYPKLEEATNDFSDLPPPPPSVIQPNNFIETHYTEQNLPPPPVPSQFVENDIFPPTLAPPPPPPPPPPKNTKPPPIVPPKPSSKPLSAPIVSYDELPLSITSQAVCPAPPIPGPKPKAQFKQPPEYPSHNYSNNNNGIKSSISHESLDEEPPPPSFHPPPPKKLVDPPLFKNLLQKSATPKSSPLTLYYEDFQTSSKSLIPSYPIDDFPPPPPFLIDLKYTFQQKKEKSVLSEAAMLKGLPRPQISSASTARNSVGRFPTQKRSKPSPSPPLRSAATRLSYKKH